MAIPTYGVTASVVASSTFGLAVTASTTPTTTEVGDIITEVSGQVTAVLYSKGVAPSDLTSTDEAYQLARAYVRKMAAYEVMMAAQHRVDVAMEFRRDAYARQPRTLAVAETPERARPIRSATGTRRGRTGKTLSNQATTCGRGCATFGNCNGDPVHRHHERR